MNVLSSILKVDIRAKLSKWYFHQEITSKTSNFDFAPMSKSSAHYLRLSNDRLPVMELQVNSV
jgi:hypothetical protein